MFVERGVNVGGACWNCRSPLSLSASSIPRVFSVLLRHGDGNRDKQPLQDVTIDPCYPAFCNYPGHYSTCFLANEFCVLYFYNTHLCAKYVEKHRNECFEHVF